MRHILPHCLFVLLACYAMAQANAQIAPKQQLCKKWFYQKSKVLGVAYLPKPSEASDMIDFQADMTYSVIEEGVEKRGRWSLTPDGQMVILAQNDGTSHQLRIEKLNAQELVYTLSFDGAYEVTFYMNVQCQKWSPPASASPTEGRLDFSAPLLRSFSND